MFPFSLIMSGLDARIEDIDTNRLVNDQLEENKGVCVVCGANEWMVWGESLICTKCGFKKFKIR